MPPYKAWGSLELVVCRGPLFPSRSRRACLLWSAQRMSFGFAGNYEGKSTCLRNEQLQDAVMETKVRHLVLV